MRPLDDTQGLSDLTGVMDKLRHGGFTAMVIAMAGMVARILLSKEPISLGRAIRFVLSSGIVGYFVWMAIEEMSMAQGLKIACIGISGAAAEHIVEYAIEWVRAKGKAQVDAAKGRVGRARRKAK